MLFILIRVSVYNDILAEREFDELTLVKDLQKASGNALFLFFLSNKMAELNRTVSTKWVGTDSSKFWTLAGTENSTAWYSQYHGRVTRLPLSGSDAQKGKLLSQEFGCFAKKHYFCTRYA